MGLAWAETRTRIVTKGAGGSEGENVPIELFDGMDFGRDWPSIGGSDPELGADIVGEIVSCMP